MIFICKGKQMNAAVPSYKYDVDAPANEAVCGGRD